MLNSSEEPVRIRLEIPEMERAFDYIADKFRTACRKVDHAAFSPEIPGFVGYSGSYREAVESLIDRNQVYYRYVAGIGADMERKSHRLHGIRRRLERRSDMAASDSRYSARAVFIDTDYNGLNFFLFDDSELAIYVPGEDGHPGVGLFTRDERDINAYLHNFSGLWYNARPVNSLDEVDQVEAQLTSLRPVLDPGVLLPPRTSGPAEVQSVLLACRQLPEVARVLANRSRADRQPFEVRDEYDAQDLLQATLRSHIQHSVLEDPVGKVAAARSSRADISIAQLGILIEVKYARSAADQKRIFDELAQDLILYANWTHLRTFIFLVYNSHVLRDPKAFFKFAGSAEFLGVRFDVEIVLV